MTHRYLRSAVVALSLIGSLFAETNQMGTTPAGYLPPDASLSDQLQPSYNRSARIDVDRSADLFANISFIYWDVGQEYLDIGRTASALAPPGPGGMGAAVPPNATFPTQSFKYQPGFKIGVGFGTVFDNWELLAEYTYLHQSTTYTTGFLAPTAVALDPVLIPNEWYVNLSSAAPRRFATRMSSEWKMNLDQFDLFLNRPYYLGQRLVANTYGGLRGLWLRQRFDIASNLVDPGTAAISTTPAMSENSSRGWAIGPHVGADLNFLLGSGFRMEFDTGVSLLYMRYTTLKHRENGFADPINGEAPARGYLRPINEFGLGFGWGAYTKERKYHFDLSARYDFAIYWSQNVMRETIAYFQNNDVGYSNPLGNLNLHGLTLTTRLDF